MSIRFLLAVIVGVLLSTFAVAEQKVRLYSKGQWTLYKMELEVASAVKGEFFIFGGVCVAQTGGKNGVLNIGVGKNVVVLQIRSAKWDFTYRSRDAALKSGTRLFSFPAIYHDGYIELEPALGIIVKNYAAATVTELKAIANGRKDLEVIDYRGRIIAQFSGKGFDAVLKRTIQCGNF